MLACTTTPVIVSDTLELHIILVTIANRTSGTWLRETSPVEDL